MSKKTEDRSDTLAEYIENVSKLISESMSVNAGDVLERGPVSHAVPISEADIERLFSDFGRGVQEVSERIGASLVAFAEAMKEDPVAVMTELDRVRAEFNSEVAKDRATRELNHDARELVNIRNLLRGQGFTESSIQERPSSCVRMLVNDEERRMMIRLYASLLAAGMEPGDLSERLTDALEELNGLLEELEDFEV